MISKTTIIRIELKNNLTEFHSQSGQNTQVLRLQNGFTS